MFTRLTFLQRIQVGLVFAVAFLLVLGSNRLDKRHFATVQTTVNSVYEDRVVVQDLIYRLNNIFHAKEMRFLLEDNFNAVKSENEQIKKLLLAFGNTELTTKEYNALNELNLLFEELRTLENKVIAANDNLQDSTRVIAGKTLAEMGRKLDTLAEIQLVQSGQLTQLSNKSLGVNMLLSNLEVGFLMLLGIVMLGLIFYPVGTDVGLVDN